MNFPFIVLLIISANFIIGCDSSFDVTDEMNYWEKKERWITKVPLFLIKIQSAEAEYALVPEGKYQIDEKRYYNRPHSIDGFEKGEIVISKGMAYQVPIEIIAIIRKGTILTPKNIVKFKKFSWFFGEAEFVRIFGSLNDDNYSDFLVDFEDILVKGLDDKGRCCQKYSLNSDILEKLSSKKALILAE